MKAADLFIGWVKIAALFVAVPGTILLAALAWFGISKVEDVRKRVDEASASIDSARKAAIDDIHQRMAEAIASIDGARNEAAEISQQATQLRSDYARLQLDFGSVAELAGNVRNLSKKVQQIEEEISFENASELPQDTREDLENAIMRYRVYFARLGYSPQTARITIGIDTRNSRNAYYDGAGKIVIDKEMVDMPEAIYRSYTHRALETIHGWDYLDNRGWSAIESGLADYFPCSYQNNARFGERFVQKFASALPPEFNERGLLRDLTSKVRFDAVIDAEQHVSGEAWGAAFWDIRSLLTQDRADELLFKAWAQPTVEDKSKDTLMIWQGFAEEITKSAGKTLGAATEGEIRKIFSRRGLLSADPISATGDVPS
jgi:hypothetical protein